MKVAVAIATFFVFEIYKNKCYNKLTTIIALFLSLKDYESECKKGNAGTFPFLFINYSLTTLYSPFSSFKYITSIPNFPIYFPKFFLLSFISFISLCCFPS